ncbi:MAG: glycine cleavage system aminomethyltransferase GcvT [Bdellovibrionota bacterium]
MKKTPLNQAHIDAGARMVDFGGWHMPVQYTGLSQEHQAVRTKAGLFDVSHMGEVTVEGERAEEFLNYLVTNNVSKLKPGQAQYTVMCYESGGVVDDLLIYLRAPKKYLLCINAGNTDKDWDWIALQGKKFPDVKLKNVSDEFCQIAIQGPLSEKIMSELTSYDLKSIKYYHFAETDVAGEFVILSRTGYTGEDGFEIYAPAALATKLWNKIYEAGQPLGLLHAGLGARDTLRTEMKMPLYGHELDAETNPLEAGLAWVVKLDKPNDFLGKEALLKIKAEGPKRVLVGLKTQDRGIPRQGYDVFNSEGTEKLGKITSGTQSPTLGAPIAIAFVKQGWQKPGTKLSVQIRDRFFPAEVVPTPFYKRKE